MQILIVGAGIAGLTAAQLLAERGHAVTIFERAPAPRDAGYMIDFFGPGFDVAERMGLLSSLACIHYPVPSLRFVDPQGRVHCVMDYPKLRGEVFGGRHFNFMRGDLERVLRQRLGDRASLRFGTTVEEVARNDAEWVQVRTSSGSVETYDLLIGADGVRSQVRQLMFARRAQLEPLAARTAAFVLARDLGLHSERFDSVVTEGRTAAAYPVRGGLTATMFVWAAEQPLVDRSPRACLEELGRQFVDCGELTERMLRHLDHAQEIFYDDLVYVRLSPWSRGRVVLLGDACGCVSLLAGQGASLAMAGAWILSRELGREGPLEDALARYEARMRPAVEGRQRTARRSRTWFVPPSARRARCQLRATHYLLRSPLASWFGHSLGGGAIDLDPQAVR